MKYGVKIFKVANAGNIKANAEVVIEDAFVVKNVRIVQGENGVSVKMPSIKYEVNGETKYKDVFHPITAEARKEFDAAVIAEYNAAE